MTAKIRVGVLLGGRSSEREISLETGRNIVNVLDRSRYESVPLYMDGRGRIWSIGLNLLLQNTTRDIDARLEHDAELVAYDDLSDRVDIVYIALHGKYGEDGCLQGLLELLDVPYTGSGVLASALGMDKTVQRRLLRHAGLDVPRHHAVARAAWSDDPDGTLDRVVELGFPLVVKPAREGCSTGLAVVEERGDLAAAIDAALEWDNTALVEERLQGVEVTVAVLEMPVSYPDPPAAPGKPRSDSNTPAARPAVEAATPSGNGAHPTPTEGGPEKTQEVAPGIGVDYPVGQRRLVAFPPTETPPQQLFLTIEEKFLPGHGKNITPARLAPEMTERVEAAAVRAFEALGLAVYARMDMYVTDDGRVVIGEPNTLPGSTPSSTIFLGPMEQGISPRELLTAIVEGSLEAHRLKKGPLG